jgi:hypothetical protein
VGSRHVYALAVTVFLCVGPARAETASLLIPTGSLHPRELPAAALESHLALVDSGALVLPRLEIELPGGRRIVAVAKRIDRRSSSDLSWVGTIEGEREGSVLLERIDERLAGAIESETGRFEIVPAGPDLVEVARLDTDLYPPCESAGEGEPVSFDADPADGDVRRSSLRSFALSSATAGVSDGGAGDDGTAITLDLLSVYTPQARIGAGGEANLAATLRAAVTQANLAFENSRMSVRFRLVAIAEVSRADSANLAADLAWVRANAGVAALRDRFGADLVSLIVEDGGGACGRGYVLAAANSPASFGGSAFQVTQRDCAVGNLTLAHEHGHNLGFQHDRANGSPPEQAYATWGFGHVVDGHFRTVMAYSETCTSGCPRIAYFSNPAVTYGGRPTGVEGIAANHRVGDAVAPYARDWRGAAILLADDFESGTLAHWSGRVP